MNAILGIVSPKIRRDVFPDSKEQTKRGFIVPLYAVPAHRALTTYWQDCCHVLEFWKGRFEVNALQFNW